MAGPTRPIAPVIAAFGLVPGAQPLAVAEQQEQDVVGADAEQHHDQERRDGAGHVEVERLADRADQPGGDLGDGADGDQRQQRDDRAAEDDQQQDQDQPDGGDRDDGVGGVPGRLLVHVLGGGAGHVGLEAGAGDDRGQVRPRRLDRVDLGGGQVARRVGHLHADHRAPVRAGPAPGCADPALWIAA